MTRYCHNVKGHFDIGKRGHFRGNDNPFFVGCRAFEGYWSSQTVDVTNDFLSAYRRRWQRQQDSTGGQRVGEGVQGTMIFIKNRLDKRGRLRYYT
jgi:hypothetical protein